MGEQFSTDSRRPHPQTRKGASLVVTPSTPLFSLYLFLSFSFSLTLAQSPTSLSLSVSLFLSLSTSSYSLILPPNAPLCSSLSCRKQLILESSTGQARAARRCSGLGDAILRQCEKIRALRREGWSTDLSFTPISSLSLSLSLSSPLLSLPLSLALLLSRSG